jgi:hypothetical protein
MTTTNADVRDAAIVDSDSHEEKGIGATVDMSAVGEEARPIDPEVARRVLRKIDMFLMPAMLLGAMITSMFLFSRLCAN